MIYNKFIFYRAAEFDRIRPSSIQYEREAHDDKQITDKFDELSIATQSPVANLSLGSGLTYSDNMDEKHRKQMAVATEDTDEKDTADDGDENNSSDEVNEIVIQVGAEEEECSEKGIIRQPSTTEYLSGMIHILSPIGLCEFSPSDLFY